MFLKRFPQKQKQCFNNILGIGVCMDAVDSSYVGSTIFLSRWSDLYFENVRIKGRHGLVFFFFCSV